jgi:predicted ester cyclase
MGEQRGDRVAFYERYIARCNQYRFDELGEFVDADVRVHGPEGTRGLGPYVAGLRAVVDAFPDFHWRLEHLLVDGEWLSARLTDTGTHTGTFLDIPATGQSVSVQELAVYRLADGRIVECWGDLGAAVRDRLIPSRGPRR